MANITTSSILGAISEISHHQYFAQIVKVSSQKMFLLIQPGRKVSLYATKLNCIITTCRVNQSVYNNRKIQAILHDNSDLSDVSF